MTLRKYGFFKELEHGDDEGGELASMRGSALYDPILRERIVRYLESGELLIACPGLARDVLSGGDEVSGCPSVLTDGQWAWPGDLAYYVRKYDVPISQQMLQSMQSNGWVIPIIEDVGALEL